MADTTTDNTFISKASPPSASMNYAALRAQGLAYIQKIASASWSDHNIHDPGITILENLAYAITDLGARTNKNMEDLLVAADQSTGGKDFFYAEEILPSGAVTIADYRKLLIDHDGIRNAWLFKSTFSEQQIYLDFHLSLFQLSYNPVSSGSPPGPNKAITLNGLYNVLLEFEGDLNSNILNVDIEISDSGIIKTHTLEIAFPFADEMPATWAQGLVFSDITLQDIDGMPPGTKLRKLEAGIDYLYSAIMNVTYNGSPMYQMNVKVQLTSAMQHPDTELTLVEAAIINKLLENGMDSVIKKYNSNIVNINDTINAVKKCLYNNRNLCEDFYAFNATRVQEIGIKAELQLPPDANTEQTIAEMFFQLDQSLSPPIHFYSLEEMLEKGKTIDEIYDGPLLKNGFIQDEDLIDLKRENAIYTSDLIHDILDLNRNNNETEPIYTGQNKKIISVSKLSITNYISNQPIVSNVRNCLNLTLSDIYKPRLSIGKSVIKVFKNNIETSYSKSQVVTNFKTLKDQQIKTPAATSVLPTPAGNFLDLENYYSIQNDFPQTYGISHAGLPDTATNERLAQVKQLKAYLLVFEQLLANYLSQLGHIKQLFSIDAGVNDTYFWQSLDTVPGVTPLLRSTYYTAVPGILKKQEQTSSGSRRNNFLDHLLGHFGEDLTDFALLMHAINYGNTPPDPELTITDKLINSKAVFLREYADLSYDRAKSYNYSGATWNTDNVAWLKKRICSLLDIETYQQQDIYGSNIEGFHMVEHILLRPKINDPSSGAVDNFFFLTRGKIDVYSLRLSFIVPDWPGRFTDPDFKVYMEKIIRRETPVHIQAKIFWIDQTVMQKFEASFKAWLIAVATQTDAALITPAKNDLISVLNSLHI